MKLKQLYLFFSTSKFSYGNTKRFKRIHSEIVTQLLLDCKYCNKDHLMLRLSLTKMMQQPKQLTEVILNLPTMISKTTQDDSAKCEAILYTSDETLIYTLKSRAHEMQ